MLAVGAGEGCLDFFLSILLYMYLISLALAVRDGSIYGLKYCLKEPLNPQTNQPTVKHAVKNSLLGILITAIVNSVVPDQNATAVCYKSL